MKPFRVPDYCTLQLTGISFFMGLLCSKVIELDALNMKIIAFLVLGCVMSNPKTTTCTSIMIPTYTSTIITTCTNTMIFAAKQ